MKIPVTGRAPRQASNYPLSVVNTGNASLGFAHAANQAYTATLWVNGVPFQCILDTGSSDTWVDTSVANIVPPDMFYTGANSSTGYADGTVAPGQIMLANLTLGPYTVVNQAVQVVQHVSPDPNIVSGLIGLAMIAQSNIHDALVNTSYAENGRPLLVNVFAELSQEHNYFTFLMDRDELGVTDGGVLTISELVTEYAAVTTAPRLEVLNRYGWSTWLDGMSVNGQFVDGHSVQDPAYFGGAIPEGKTVAVIDSGSSFVTAPQAYVDAVYKDIPGAVPTNETSGAGPGYIIPCDTKFNISFHFGGQEYPIHPIDAVVVNQTANGILTCIGALTTNVNGQGLLTDWLIGDAFMRAVYSLYDYGNVTNPNAGSPYVQLLSIIDADTAWAETDELLLKRLVAYQSHFTSTYGSTPTTTQLAYTGPTSSVALTSADDKQTFAPLSTASLSVVRTSSASPVSGYAAATGTPNVLSGAVSEDAVVSDSGAGQIDLSGLTRNSFIIIGMLAASLVLLVVVAALAVRASRGNKGYRAVPGLTGGVPPKAFVDPYTEY
ncbi:aspartic peptidase domain-containing protein [Trametes gibbosa]|nr:aspartic peptidase domain-containing protein [Trametes gibbosa]